MYDATVGVDSGLGVSSSSGWAWKRQDRDVVNISII